MLMLAATGCFCSGAVVHLACPDTFLFLVRIAGIVLNLLEAASFFPIVLQHIGPECLVLLNTLHKRDIDSVQVGAFIRRPLLVQGFDDTDTVSAGRFDDDRVMVSCEEGKAQGDGLSPAHSSLQCRTQGSGAQSKDGRGVSSVVWTTDDKINGTFVLKVMVQSNLHT